ncbi:protein lev-9 [Caerostris extrusa]|uniref:Protein lev-9 n=1 Tax=Caerostris extrusa TaxID=172846 RepID=A0AAV4WL31_CAEEX|nr:protein lev-9 [Caerostris extrusa]
MENGSYKVTGDHFGARVMYSCDDGYWMSGPKERVCQGDGSWVREGPNADRKLCVAFLPKSPTPVTMPRTKSWSLTLMMLSSTPASKGMILMATPGPSVSSSMAPRSGTGWISDAYNVYTKPLSFQNLIGKKL